MAVQVGVVVFILGLFRFGFIDNVLSRPLLSGFINALALYIISEQGTELASFSLGALSV